MRLLRYSLLRLLILAACAGVLHLAGLRSWLLAIVALVVAALVSYLALPKARLGAARALAEHDPARRRAERPERPKSRTRRRAAQDASDEDAEIESQTRA